MQPINICNVRGMVVNPNETSGVLSQGTYDVYAKDLAVILVGVKGKLTDLSADNGYTMPAGSVISMVIDKPKMSIRSTAKINVVKVG